MKWTQDISLDKAVEIIAGLGIPGLVLIMLMAASPWFGAAAIATSLAALGLGFGMLGGIATLGILAFISKALAKFGFEELFKAVLVKLKKDGVTYEEILKKIDKYPISKELKRKLREFIEEFYEVKNHEQ